MLQVKAKPAQRERERERERDGEWKCTVLRRKEKEGEGGDGEEHGPDKRRKSHASLMENKGTHPTCVPQRLAMHGFGKESEVVRFDQGQSDRLRF